ncbi:MAG: ribose-phosphate pyrophosphokinase, partial [Planctomycetaceae bacterium]|nr:ribose-phosphate pyrophosphokinase [Planctomycetaceae bacterium]
IGEVKDRNVLLVDDFIITGRSLTKMADVLRQRGAKDIYATVSHPAFAEGAAQRIADSPIRRMFITDTIETFPDLLPECFTIVSVARQFAEAIRSIHDRTSVSMLFPEGH